MSRPLVICSGTVNRYGFRLLPEGGRLNSYKKNPVLLYDHGSHGKQQHIPIGRLEVALQNGVLVGVPEFDMDDKFAAGIAKKWNKGYLNAGSVGFEPITLTGDPELILPGQTNETVSEWELLEVSITPLPADRDAVKLSLDKGQSVGRKAQTRKRRAEGQAQEAGERQ